MASAFPVGTLRPLRLAAFQDHKAGSQMGADTKADAVRESSVASWDGEAFLKTARINGKEIFFDYQPASAPRTGLVEGRVLVELKAVKAIEDIHIAQALNYLKATELLLKKTTAYSQNEIHHGF